MLLESFAGIACAGAGVVAYGVRGRSAALFGPSVWRGARDRDALALTFDDGPSESTPELLELLDRHQARATFFQIGMHARRLPSVAREIAAAGHQIGNHSESHRAFYLQPSRVIFDELARAQDSIESASGVRPALFRAPFGARWFGLREIQRRLDLLGVMWTTIARDWKLPAEAIAKRLSAAAVRGSIFCLHDGRGAATRPDIRATLKALARLLPELKDRGYHFETVSEILCPKN